MKIATRILVGHAYQTGRNEIFPVNMQGKTLSGLIKQANEVLINDGKFIAKWSIKKKIFVQEGIETAAI